MPAFEQDFLLDFSDESIIRELQRVAALEPRAPFTYGMLQRLGRVSPCTVSRRFGGWKRALQQAGLLDRWSGRLATQKMRSQDAKRYSNTDLLAELRRVAARLGTASLTASYFNEHSPISASAIRGRFGSWEKGLETAGILSWRAANRRKRADCYTRLLQSAARKLGKRSVTLSEFDGQAMGVSSKVVRRFFGSWSAALGHAGLGGPSTPIGGYSKDACLNNLFEVWVSLRRQPSYADIQKPPSVIGPKAYERLWRSYSTALRAFSAWVQRSETRLGQARARGVTDFSINSRALTISSTQEELAGELKRVAAIVGRTAVTQDDVIAHSNIDPRTFRKRFGSWPRSLAAAGLEGSIHSRRYSQEDYFKNLLEVWEHLGRRPLYREMSSATSSITAEAYYQRFGSWRKALLCFLNWVNQPDPGTQRSLPDEAAPKPASKSRAARRIACEPRASKGRVPAPRLRFRVFMRDHFACVFCGRSRATDPSVCLHVDHIVPWTRGGGTALENLQTACSDCNIGKGDLLVEHSSSEQKNEAR